MLEAPYKTHMTMSIGSTTKVNHSNWLYPEMIITKDIRIFKIEIVI